LEVFLRDVCKLSVADLPAHQVETQVTVTGGRADLVISAPNLHLIFEAKVASSLHGSQMLSYLQALRDSEVGPNGTKGLFILAPAASMVQLSKEATAQLAVADPTCEVRAISWQVVAKVLDDLSRKVGSTSLGTHLATFRDLVLFRLGGADEPFGAEELALLADPLAGRAIKRVSAVYEQVVDVLKAEKRSGITVTNSSGQKWQGRTLRSGGRWWWFGIWPDAWAASGGSPLFLQLPGVGESGSPMLPEARFLDGIGSGSALPLPLNALESPSSAATRIAALILRIVRELPDTGGPSSTMPVQDPPA
jgi:hypothetical protein